MTDTVRLLVLPKHRDTVKLAQVLAAISTLDPEQRWDIEIRKRTGVRRTDQQNRYLWGVVYATILKRGGEALRGWEAKDIHEYFLGEHFGWEKLTGFGRTRVRPLRRSSRLNKQEFADYLDFIIRKVGEIGIDIPDPAEYLTP